MRAAFTISITLATATLKRYTSIAEAASSINRCTTVRSPRSPVAASTPGSLVTSPASRQARARNRRELPGETSDQSMSSSGGPANTIDSRIASTPCSLSSSDSRTRLPRDLLMAEPSITTMPWLSSRVKGSAKSTMPMSCSTLVKNRE